MARRRKSRSVRAKGGRMVDPGPDASGRYAPSPWHMQHGHLAETAPRDLRSTPDSSFPKRIVTQRVLDRYKAHKHITAKEWQAGNALWELWNGALLDAKVTSGYEPVIMSSPANMDARIARKIDSATAFLEVMALVPYRSRGVVRAVCIEDWSVSDWDNLARRKSRDSGGIGMEHLRQGLRALAEFWGY